MRQSVYSCSTIHSGTPLKIAESKKNACFVMFYFINHICFAYRLL